MSLIGLQVTGIEEREEDTEESLGEFGASDYAGMISYAHRIGEDFSLGGSLKYISSKIEDEEATGVG